MKRDMPFRQLVLAVLPSLMIAGCANAPRPISENGNSPSTNIERRQTAIGHSSENQPPPASRWTQGGDAFDTSELDAAIERSEKGLSAKPNDPAAKKALAAAYLKRASALTEKRQYAAALGDYRRTLKYDPENAEAKDWIERIVGIYQSIGRTYPKEGEEPPPLPFAKSKEP